MAKLAMGNRSGHPKRIGKVVMSKKLWEKEKDGTLFCKTVHYKGLLEVRLTRTAAGAYINFHFQDCFMGSEISNH